VIEGLLLPKQSVKTIINTTSNALIKTTNKSSTINDVAYYLNADKDG